MRNIPGTEKSTETRHSTKRFAGLPEKGDPAVPHTLGVRRVSGQLAPEEAFFGEGTQHQQSDGDDGQQCGGGRLQPQRRADEYEKSTGVHWMPYDVIRSGVYDHLLSCLLVLDDRRRECVLAHA